MVDIDINASDKTGNDWYDNKAAASLSNTDKAKKKYQQLLYTFFDTTDDAVLAQRAEALNIDLVDGDFLSAMISLHKHIAPFQGDGGKGYDRTEQADGNYVRSNDAHPLNELHQELLRLKGQLPGDWIQPLNHALLNLQGRTRDQRGVERLPIANQLGGRTFDTVAGRLSTSSAGLPINNMNLLLQAQHIAKTRGRPNSYFTGTNNQKGYISAPVLDPPSVVANGNTINIHGPGQGLFRVSNGARAGVQQTIDNHTPYNLDIPARDARLKLGQDDITATAPDGGTFVLQGQVLGVYQNNQLTYGYLAGNATARLTNIAVAQNGNDTLANANRLLFAPTNAPNINESRGLQNDVDQEVQRLSGYDFQQLIKQDGDDQNAHDNFLNDRARVIDGIAARINGAGVNGVRVIGSGEHPSLIIHIPHIHHQNNYTFYYRNAQFATGRNPNTDEVLPAILNDFNAGAVNWDVKATRRGSFGFQRPTFTDTGESVRFWPGYAPVESLTAGLERVMAGVELGARQVANGGVAPALAPATDLGLAGEVSDFARPQAHLSALKTAMRHAHIALQIPDPQGVMHAGQARVVSWLKTRILIKLKQSETVLRRGQAVAQTKVDDPNANILADLNKNFLIAADLTDKIQEYAFMYTSAMLTPGPNPNAVGAFKDDNDHFEKHLRAELGAIRGDHRVFYLDSGEQALVAAGLLANRYRVGVEAAELAAHGGADENASKLAGENAAVADNVAPSGYQDLNSYFEIGVFGGAGRSNLTQDPNGQIIHADLSPVVTTGNRPTRPQVNDAIKGTFQEGDGSVAAANANKIPIIDITNSTLSEVANLGAMPDNFILVESLTKHEQLGADKFIMGRLIAVQNANTAAINGVRFIDFLQLAQRVVGPIANEAYNPVLHQVRKQMDQALYKKNDPNQFAVVLHAAAPAQPRTVNQAIPRPLPQFDIRRLLRGVQPDWLAVLARAQAIEALRAPIIIPALNLLPDQNPAQVNGPRPNDFDDLD